MTDVRITAPTPLDADTVAMLRGSLRHVLTETSDRPLADRLADLGWDDVVAGDGPTALGLLFALKGDTLSGADALGPELARHLAAVAGDAGLSDTDVLLPSPFGASTATGTTRDADLGAMVQVDQLGLAAPRSPRVVFALDGRLVQCATTALVHDAVGGFDDALGLVRVTGAVPATAVTPVAGATWDDLLTHGRRLVAAELVGIGHRVVALAVEYTGQRVQYGKPIGVFQALQHRLASAHALVTGAGHLAAEAATSDDPWVATVAKCLAGRSAEEACTQAQQCFGAIGFTWEHELHRYLRRTYTLDRLLGGWRSLEGEIGRRLLADRAVPHIGSL